MAITLDKRLQTVAAMVRPGAQVADVGTDHGLLLAWLALSGKITRGFACDINPMPLAKAQKVIDENGLQKQLTAVLCDGLSGVFPAEVDDVVIAGMGGELIARILEDAPWLQNPQKHLILQPMTKPACLREYLFKSGYTIKQELAVKSQKHIYSVMLAAYTGTVEEADPLMLHIGKVVEGDSPDTAAYLQMVQKTLVTKVEGLRHAGHQTNRQREAEYLLTALVKRMEEYQNDHHR